MEYESKFDWETWIMDLVDDKNRGLITVTEFVIHIERVVMLLHEKYTHMATIETNEQLISHKARNNELLQVRINAIEKQLISEMKE